MTCDALTLLQAPCAISAEENDKSMTIMADYGPPSRPRRFGDEQVATAQQGGASRSEAQGSWRHARTHDGRRPDHRRPAYAAIDLGTNNCRLLIARPAGDDFVVIDAFSRVVRLGEGVAQTGRLGDEAMRRALDALKICADKLRRRDVHLARSVATEACRRAANGPQFIEQVRDETGILLDIISAEEEAKLAVMGCHILLGPGDGPAIIFDIGGGSTELVLVETSSETPRIIDWQSVPWGVVSLTETCGGDAVSDDQAARLACYAAMRAQVTDALVPFTKRLADAQAARGWREELRLLGSSGTVTTLASLHLGLPQYDRQAVDGLIMEAEAMRVISSGIAAMSLAERRALPSIGRDRADLVVAGCAILEAILDIWPAQRLGVADRGIREGILRHMMQSTREGDAMRAQLRRMRG